ncbi:penicillin-binding protein (plasmid) [Arthrobacter sp. ERGS1:01]|uniref:serine hydrolase domain-containing protein n=1 Tax=Arthrobacter sp. ERGS1:01 TaxID=1704044 RepID=UPI0006B48332|nr:serine hydrolase domain-containing protein [Arthrobacter sp. ERGS1:01]ALE04170.1 penicillin-binding protein [Arthrobacter sp. ERGS1:01]
MAFQLLDDFLASQAWQNRIDALAKKYSVPGVQVGVIALDGEGRPDMRVMTTGVTSLATGIEVTPDTLFQYGSISKVWTTTLIMQLVDEGKLTLETPVVEILPEFSIADIANTKKITIRHLLTHTSGIDGDLFTDTGDNDDCVEKYVDELATAISVTPAGGQLSYSNSAFTVAGRIIEVLRGKPWDDVVVERLVRPLGLTHLITRTKEAPLFSTAVGHLANPDTASADKVIPATRWMLPRSIGPAGSITGSMSSLLKFAAAHLRDGLALSGERILSVESTRLMRAPQFDLTAVSTVDQAWGLGWVLSDWGTVRSAYHGGATIGQIARLQTFPQLQMAIAVLTNSRGGSGLAEEIETAISVELGLAVPKPVAESPAESCDLTQILGTYESTSNSYELALDDGRYYLTAIEKADVNGEPQAPPFPVVPLSNTRFLIEMDGKSYEFTHLLLDGNRYLYSTRLYKLTSD